jgi:hypothetical protein
MITDFINSVMALIQDLIGAMNTFYTNIIAVKTNLETITSGGHTPFTTYLGAFRYVVGDLIYSMYFLITLFGCCYTIYILIKGVINTINKARLSVFKLPIV